MSVEMINRIDRPINVKKNEKNMRENSDGVKCFLPILEVSVDGYNLESLNMKYCS